MKTTHIIWILCLSLMVATWSCSGDDAPSKQPEQTNTGALKLFLIDTAKVNTITETGTSETTVINRMVNQNSYLGALSISPDGKKLVYSEYQASFVDGTPSYIRRIRVANADGSSDEVLSETSDPQMYYGVVKYGAGQRIYYMSYNAATNARQLHTVNQDGTNATSVQMGYRADDISGDGQFLITETEPTATGFRARIIDLAGDNGAGSLVGNIDFQSNEKIGNGVITADGKNVVHAYISDGTLRLRVTALPSAKVKDVQLATGFGSQTLGLTVSMGSDSIRGVVTVSDFNSEEPSKTYVFKMITAAVTSSFSNNDDNIFDVYAW